MTATSLPATNAELQAVLAAWHEATSRLEKTHLVLQDEVRRLSNELEVKNRELARKNRLADLGQVASHVAHEVRNNLAPVTLYLGMLKRRLTNDHESQAILSKVVLGVADMDTLVNDLLHFAAEREPELASVALSTLLQECIERLAPQFDAHNIHVEINVPAKLNVSVDAAMFRRVVINLMINAVDAMREGGDIQITAAAVGNTVQLMFADSGPGVPQDVLARMFEPFYTTKGSGTGLGLTIAGHIVERHGGTLTAHNSQAEATGAVFEITLPAVN